MALTAVVATGVAVMCAAWALDIPPALIGITLLPGIQLTYSSPDRRPLGPGRDVAVLGWLTAAGALIIFLIRPTNYAAMASLVLFVVAPLSLLWPSPAVVRYSLLLAAGCIAVAGVSLPEAGLALAGFAAASAVALVTLARMSTADVPNLSPTTMTTRRKRVAGEAAALFLVAGLVALLAASLLPPPPASGQRPSAGGRPSRGDAGEATPYLQPTDRLDAGGPGTGKGNQVVFRVSADAPALWRTMTFDGYDGRIWTRTPAFEPDEEDAFAGEELVDVPPGIGDSEISGGLPLEQKITVAAPFLGVLAAAARPSFVQLRGGGAVVGADGTVVPVPALGKGATYLVTSFLPTAEGAGAAAAPSRSPVPPEIGRFYLPFPALPTRIRDLAGEITAGAATPFGSATALEDWFRATTEVRAGTSALPSGEDPVDRYLFTNRAGSAQQAASAMAVMLRSLGIPARLAVGYVPGDRSAFGGEFVVRAKHAHAWVEAWFPGTGWLAFDPAGRFSGSTPNRDSLLDRLLRLLKSLWWVLVVVGLLAVAWLVRWAVRRSRRRRARPWATRCYERLEHAGRDTGRPRQPSETPAEYCAALAAEVPDERLVEVGELLTVAAWSEREPPPEARAWADGVVDDLVRKPSSRSRRRVPAATGNGLPPG